MPKNDASVVPLTRLDVSKLDLNDYHTRINFGPDADRDALQDVLVTTGWDSDGFAFLALISSKTGKPCFCRREYVGLLRLEQQSPAPNRPDPLAWDAGGDVDGDGVHDILFRIPERSLVVLLSGKDGHLLRSFRGKTEGFGASCSLGPDIDGDGKSDLAVGSPGARLVQLLSGESGKEIKRWTGTKELKGFGRMVVLRAFHGQKATLAIASDRQASLFDPRERAGALFSFGSGHAPDSMSVSQDVDGDGFRDFLADFSGAWNIFSIRSREILGAHRGVPFADVDGDGKLDWISSVDSGLLMFATDDGAPPAVGMRNLKPVMPVPLHLATELKQDSWDVDESGRHLLTWSDADDILTLHALGAHAPVASAPPPVVSVAPQECPFLFPLTSNFPPEAEAVLVPTLSQLAENLEEWGRASESASYPMEDKRAKAKLVGQRASAGLALTKIADPKAGLWFWENSGILAIPSVRFPPSPRQRGSHPTIAIAARGAASHLRKALGQPDFARTVTRSPVVIADLLHNLEDRDEGKRLDRRLLRRLPIQAKIRLAPSPGSDDESGSLEIYLTVRGKRLYVAHVIYQDGSA